MARNQQSTALLGSWGGSIRSMDLIDSIASNVWVLAAAASTGIVSNFDVMGTHVLGEFMAFSGTQITWALALSLLAVLVMWITNEKALEDMDGVQAFGVAGLIAMIVALDLVPGVHNWVHSADMIGLAYMAVLSAGYYIIAYRW